MAYQVQGSVIINDSRELLGVNTAGITNDLYVGGNIDAQAGIITANQFIGDGSQLTGIITDGGSGGTVSEINVTGLASLTELTVSGVATFSANIDLENNDIINGGAGNFTSLDVAGHIEGDTLNISGVSTLVGNAELGGQLSFTGGDADEVVSGITTDLEESAGAEELVTAEGVKSYVDAQISETGGTLNVAGDSGTGSVDLSSQTFTIAGTSLEVETSAADQTITIGLPNDVSIGGSITAGTYYGDGQFLTGIGGDSVDLTGTDQSFNSLELTGVGVALTVNNQSEFNGTITLGSGAEIHGPANIVIDPAVIGDNTGSVTIKGDLIVQGTEFIVESTTVSIADKKIGLATNIGTDVLLDGAGIGIGSGAVEKTFLYNNTTGVLESNTGLGVTAGGAFKIGNDEVLTAGTLGATIVDSSLTSVGNLTDLTVDGDINANGDIVGDGATNISGINSVTATTYYGNGQFLTGIGGESVDLTGTSQSFLELELTSTGIGLTANQIDINGHADFADGMSVTGIVTATDFNSTSDIRKKDNIVEIDGAVEKVKQLRGVTFDWKDGSGHSGGVIAQDVEAILPTLVKESDHKTVIYNGIIGLLVQAVKEQRAQIEELQSKLG